jgi:hypothetical protein
MMIKTVGQPGLKQSETDEAGGEWEYALQLSSWVRGSFWVFCSFKTFRWACGALVLVLLT